LLFTVFIFSPNELMLLADTNTSKRQMKFVRCTAGSSLLDYRSNENILEELNP